MFRIKFLDFVFTESWYHSLDDQWEWTFAPRREPARGGFRTGSKPVPQHVYDAAAAPASNYTRA